MHPVIVSCLRPLLLILLFLGFSPALLHGQGRREDYQRAEALKERLRNKVYHAPQTITWSGSGKWLFYTVQTPRGKEFMAVDPAKKKRLVAFDHEKMARKLSEATSGKIEPYNLPLTAIKCSHQRRPGD